MSDETERECWIEHDGLRLEGLLRTGAGSLAAVILHPHPHYGGDMHNHVVTGLGEALAEAGAATLRFNFRGVGRSAGVYDGGAGEASDAVAAIDFLRARAPDARVVLAGYSFGAMVAAAAATMRPLDGLLLVSPPLAFAALPPLPDGVPVLAIAGDRDPLAPLAAILAIKGAGVQTAIVEGADHGWWPGLESLTAEAAKFAEQLISAHSDA